MRPTPALNMRRIVWFVVALSLLSLLGAYLLKTCPGGFLGRGLLCYSDIRQLFIERDIAHIRLPYVHGGMQGGRMLPGSIEYPVLTGLFAWVVARPVSTHAAYLLVSAILLAPFGLCVSYLLARMTGLRALLWVVSPSLILYGFLNWDLLVVGATMVGVWLWARDRAGWAAVAFAVGASLKLYPVLLLPSLALDAGARHGRGSALRAVSIFVATVSAINLPFIIVNAEGWLVPYRFQQTRPASDSIWLAVGSWSPDQINLASAALILASLASILVAGRLRQRREGEYPVLQTSAAVVSAFILWNKVYSPQYVLWLLPFFALLTVGVAWWIAYGIIDVCLMGGVLPLWAQVPATTALLAGLTLAFLRSDRAPVALDLDRLRAAWPLATASTSPQRGARRREDD